MKTDIPQSVRTLTEERIKMLEGQVDLLTKEIRQLEFFLGIQSRRTTSLSPDDSGLAIAQFCAYHLNRPFSRQDIRTILNAMFDGNDIEKMANRISVALTTEKKRVQERDFNWFTLENNEYFAPVEWFHDGFLALQYTPVQYMGAKISPGGSYKAGS